MNKRPIKRLRHALKNSEVLQHPIKYFLAHKLRGFLSAGLFILLLPLPFLPLSPRSIIAECLALLLALCFAFAFIKPSKSNLIPRRFWFLLLVMLVFASFCPYIVAPKPAYIAVLPSHNPFNSKLSLLQSGGKTIGSIMLVSEDDYIRQILTALLNRLSPDSFRILHRTEHGSNTHYTLPIFHGFVFDIGEPWEMPAKSNVYFPMALATHNINLFMQKPLKPTTATTEQKDNFVFSVEIGTSIGALINCAYTQYPDTIPWDGVQVSGGQDISTILYTALLDRTLEFVASGATEQALNGLDTATTLVPAQNLEGARVAALKYAVTGGCLSGNIGQLQSLPLLHNAYDLLLQCDRDPRFGAKDPLVNWVREELLDGYGALTWSTMFLDRVSTLNSIPHMSHDESGYHLHTEALEARLKGASYDEMLRFLRLTKCSSADLYVVRHFVRGAFLRDIMAYFRSNPSGAKAAARQMAEDTKEVSPLLHFLDLSLGRKHHHRPDPFSARIVSLVSVLQEEAPGVATNASPAEEAKYFSERLGHYPALAELAQFFAIYNDQINSTNKAFQGAHSPWWKAQYLIWFFGWTMGVTEKVNQHNYPWATKHEHPFRALDIQKEIERHESSYFSRDMDGNGRTFVPGLFFVAWYADAFGLPEAKKLRQRFEESPKLPLQTYVSLLFPPGNT